MKTTFSIILLSALPMILSSTKAHPIDPVDNTEWAGIANISTAQNVVLQFKRDDLNVSLKDTVFESIKFAASNDTLTIEEKLGGLPSPVNRKGVYQYVMKGDELSFKYISYESSSRQYNITVSNLKKMVASRK
ncbi:hypothetical protein [Chryseobacterium sp. MP_3.2]|uniref:hypothetical protein n=1 Tax=Chryseobacterium sp. MP_3.2 TaxID=3071712 RepID=UPI002E06D558|nr:hypothetical protein [Chryseobacterium sp. MP_3.2]